MTRLHLRCLGLKRKRNNTVNRAKITKILNCVNNTSFADVLKR